jgi:hypothetical protein
MNRVLTLRTLITIEELDIYRKSKNVDSVSLLLRQYHEFLNIFFKKNVDSLLEHRFYDHVIKLKDDFSTFNQTLCEMSRNEIEKLRRYLDENLTKKFIRVSKSLVVFLVMFVKKSEEKLRFCVDYQDLNAITIKNRYSLSLIIEILNRLSRTKMFIKLNIISAFNRLRIKKEDEKLITFKIRFDLFELLILFFKLCNDSVFFQHFINDTLREYLNDFCTIYLNDILIYSEIETEHEIHVKRILLKLRETELQANIIKCKFHVTKIVYLELIVIIKRIKMNLVKIDIVINWSISVNMKDVQSFLEFVNFYKRFVYDFSKIVDFLINLIKKNIKFL